jgi:hypothetical protein
MAQLRFSIDTNVDDSFSEDAVTLVKSFSDDLDEEASLDTQVDCFVNFLRAQGYEDLEIDQALQYGI